MLPKLLDVPISTYLIVLAKIRRPSATPSASTSRSFSSRITSAASLATSVAESTEMPTSAACRASASLTPSPRNATSPPVCRWIRTMRALCSGLTRANTVVAGDRRGQLRRRRARSRSAPVSAPPTRQTEVAADLRGDGGVVAGDDLHRDAEAGQPAQRRRRRRTWAGRGRRAGPARRRSCSSSAVSRGQPGGRRGWRRRRPGCRRRTPPPGPPGPASGTSTQRLRTASGAPLVISSLAAAWLVGRAPTPSAVRGRRAARRRARVAGDRGPVGQRGR